MRRAIQKPRPGRRRFLRMPQTSNILSVLILFTSLISITLAYDMEAQNGVQDSLHFKELERDGLIHIDTREPPTPTPMRLELRQESESPETLASISSANLATASSSTSLNSHSTSSPTETKSTKPTVSIIPTPLPSPFDTSLGSNFTSQSCPNFFTIFLSNPDFRACIPVSLLLQNSNSFFRAERDPSLLSETLDAACNAPFALCTPLLQSIAQDLIDPSNCGQDFEQQNPLVAQAYNGLIAYAPIYRATCLKDGQTGQYCFAEAISNATTSPADPYPYYTALGVPLPANSQPGCSLCLQQTMEIFATYAGNASQPLSQTYKSCADQIDKSCGAHFAATDVHVSSGGRVAATAIRSWMLVYSVTATLFGIALTL